MSFTWSTALPGMAVTGYDTPIVFAYSQTLTNTLSQRGAFAFSDNKLKNEKMLLVT